MNGVVCSGCSGEGGTLQTLSVREGVGATCLIRRGGGKVGLGFN